MTVQPRMCSYGAAEHAGYTDTMIETWLAVLGLLLLACFIWWITTGTGVLSQLARSSRAPPSPRVKAIWWVAYAVTALWVLSNSNCEGPDQMGRDQERQPRQYAQEINPGRGSVPGV